ncbi:hypothetical protein EIK77_007297 [Talaromyces pinophilus]|nr:hypothetical protein EIK77_007297 [Talaromyces pinophilus]PCG98890.1 Hypothetical protein PENO1_055980 [Penicillium occitanis (nom. inval.)]PCG99149.1 hypothetical protein PENOC_059830 [Penicillium occitanis (nom. inval.)]
MTPSLSSNTPTNTPKSQLQRQDTDDPEEARDGLTATKKRKRRPGRPLLSFAQLKSRKTAREAARRSKNEWKISSQSDGSSASILEATKSKRRNGSSALEQLPVELLERIFLYALETNFCRASPFLASAVSSERIYRTLIRLAFFKDSESEDGETPWPIPVSGQQVKTARERIAAALKPADYDTMRLDEADRANLQATILKCKWCTKQRIQAQLPALMQMTIQKHWVGTGIVISDPKQREILDNLLQVSGYETVVRIPLFEGIGPNGVTYRMVIKPLVWIHIFDEGSYFDVNHRVMGIRSIPDYLLRGRRADNGKGYHFTGDDVDLLELFRQEYDYTATGHDVHFSRDALQSGLRTAITTFHQRALTTLLKVDEFFFRRRLETIPPPGCANQCTGPIYAIPQDCFVQAIQLPMPHSMYFFIELLRGNAESMPPDSPEITQWAMELSSGTYQGYHRIADVGNKMAQAFGRWLLDFMITLPGIIDESREDPDRRALFYFGEYRYRRYVPCLLNAVNDGRPTLFHESFPNWIYDFSFDVSETWPTIGKEWK